MVYSVSSIESTTNCYLSCWFVWTSWWHFPKPSSALLIGVVHSSSVGYGSSHSNIGYCWDKSEKIIFSLIMCKTQSWFCTQQIRKSFFLRNENNMWGWCRYVQSRIVVDACSLKRRWPQSHSGTKIQILKHFFTILRFCALFNVL